MISAVCTSSLAHLTCSTVSEAYQNALRKSRQEYDISQLLHMPDLGDANQHGLSDDLADWDNVASLTNWATCVTNADFTFEPLPSRLSNFLKVKTYDSVPSIQGGCLDLQWKTQVLDYTATWIDLPPNAPCRDSASAPTQWAARLFNGQSYQTVTKQISCVPDPFLSDIVSAFGLGGHYTMYQQDAFETDRSCVSTATVKFVRLYGFTLNITAAQSIGRILTAGNVTTYEITGNSILVKNDMSKSSPFYSPRLELNALTPNHTETPPHCPSP